MNGVIGMTSLLMDTKLDNEQLEFVEIIRNSGDQLLTIINDILDFSKIEAGYMELENQPFEVRQCIEEALDLVTHRAAVQGLELSYSLGDHVPSSVVGDVTRLRQILVNLLTNAVKFTESGNVLLTVQRYNDKYSLDASRCELLFVVQDTGIGIPADRIDRLFKSFSQVDTSTTRQYGGTGLGLAICKQLVELMEGRIWVESKVNVGSKFSFTISVDVVANPVRVFLPAQQPLLVGRRVLVIEDNNVNREILCRLARKWKMKVDAVNSGHDAIQRYQEGRHYDLILLDYQMPEMDGLTVASEIGRRADPRPVIVMLTSVTTEHALRQKAEEYGVKMVLNKPVKPSMLYNTLIEIFQQEQQPQFRITEVDTNGVDINGHDNEREFKPYRVLVAEDNIINQKVAIQFLERLGYRSDVVANGMEALEALSRQPYHLVLMDVQMPEMDGLTATREVRKRLPTNRQPCIVAMTANAMKGDRESCLKAGMDDYLSKPVKFDDLKKILTEYELSSFRRVVHS
jgi:CheY-like chemotaxis protein